MYRLPTILSVTEIWTDRQAYRQTTLSCQQPIILRAVRSAKMAQQVFGVNFVLHFDNLILFSLIYLCTLELIMAPPSLSLSHSLTVHHFFTISSLVSNESNRTFRSFPQLILPTTDFRLHSQITGLFFLISCLSSFLFNFFYSLIVAWFRAIPVRF